MSKDISISLSTVLSLVRKLTRQERGLVIAAIRAVDGEEAAAASSADLASDWLLAGIEHELRRRGLLMSPLTSEALRKWAPMFTQKSIIIRAELKKKLALDPSYGELLKFGRVAAKALADMLSKEREWADLKPGPKMLLVNVDRVGEALERSFPGYMSAGLLSAVIKV